MSKIYGSLYLTNADWRFVYNTVLNYFNQEINLAYNEANSFFKVNGNLEHEDFQKKLAAIFSEREITNFRKSLIERSLLKASSKVYKPKKNAFTKYTNRTTYIKTPDVTVDFDKDLKTISIETADYDNFDKFMEKIVNTSSKLDGIKPLVDNSQKYISHIESCNFSKKNIAEDIGNIKSLISRTL